MEQQRIICILEYLEKSTDEEHWVTVGDIQNYLAANYNLKNVSAITIRRDIDRLSELGNNIRKKNGAHNTAYYSLENKGFTFNEIRFIVDSISINKFLSANQKQQIIKKFEGMCSDSEIRQLISRISINSVSSDSLDLLKNLEKIHKIISESREINFNYGKFDTHKQMKYYSKRRSLIPKRVVYFNERFYLRCFDENSSEYRTYRIDRMKDITVGEKFSEKIPDDKRYDGFVADIFPPDYFENVTFRVKKFLLDEMIEQFGKNANVRDDFDNPDCAIVRVKAGINRQFYLWVMKYGDGLEIVSPKKVRDDFVTEVKKVLQKYSDV